MTNLLGVSAQLARRLKRNRPIEKKVYIRRLSKHTVFVNSVNRLTKQLDHTKYVIDVRMNVYTYAKDGSLRLVGSVDSRQSMAIRNQLNVSNTRLRKAWLGYQNTASRDISLR